MSFEFTNDIIIRIAPYCRNKELVKNLVPSLNKWLPEYEINNQLRIEYFISQGAEETDSFNTLKEYGSGNEYNGRHDLGNINPGDGPRYKGRGIFQITGRSNYKTLGTILKIDLIDHPELAETPDVAVRTACEYWKTHNLNMFADKDDLTTITRRINGGLNGYATRKEFLINADNAIGDFFPDQDGTQYNN